MNTGEADTTIQQHDNLDNLENVVSALQNSIGAVSSNLVTAYQQLAKNMESNIKMMSNMNTMMEAMVLQNIDIQPYIEKKNEVWSASIQISNKSAFPLQSLQIQLSSENGEYQEC